MFIFALITVALFIFALGWKPDLQAIGTGIWSGIKTISLAPLDDWRAALRRVALAFGIILLLAFLWSPLPNGGSGTHAELEQAIREYQLAHHLSVDGVWGKNTNTYYLAGK